jgi:hypothetical protein
VLFIIFSKRTRTARFYATHCNRLKERDDTFILLLVKDRRVLTRETKPKFYVAHDAAHEPHGYVGVRAKASGPDTESKKPLTKQ